jgi:hypothetical protein
MSAVISGGEADLLTRRAVALCAGLGYDARPTFYHTLTGFNRHENLHVVTAAFEVIGIHAVLGLAEGNSATSFKPVVYVGLAKDDDDATCLHRRSWTQGAVPILLVVRPETVEVRDGFGPPGGDVRTYPFEPGRDVDPGLAAVSAGALTSSIHWRDRPTSRASAVDTRLVAAVEDLNRYVRNLYPSLGNSRGLVNALIGRLLYLYVLVDREIVGREWMEAVIGRFGCSGAAFAREVLHQGVRIAEASFTTDEVWAVLDGIDDLINGSVFPISFEERRLLPDDLIHLVHRVVRCGDVLEFERRQISFLDVSFEVLRTETISAIYERFLKIEDENAQRNEGAFYTPP